MLKKMGVEGEKITNSSKVDLSKLSPCYNALVPHIKRVNYRVAQWKLAEQHMPDIPSPLEHGWFHSEDFLEPHWCEGAILPTQLIDILETGEVAEDESDVEGEEMEELSSEEESDDERY